MKYPQIESEHYVYTYDSVAKMCEKSGLAWIIIRSACVLTGED